MSSPCYNPLLHLFLSVIPALLRYILNVFTLRPPQQPPLKFVPFDQPDPEQYKDIDYHHDQYIHGETGAFPTDTLPHLPVPFAIYEELLESANSGHGFMSLGEDQSEDAIARRPVAEKWRADVRAIPLHDLSDIKDDKPVLQRAHAVLAWLVHFYVHSTPPPPNKLIIVPKTIARPLVQVSQWLQIAPVLTYADTVLWNFELEDESKGFSPNNMRFTSLFNSATSANTDEVEFYRCCAWIEQRGFDCCKAVTDLIRDFKRPPPGQTANQALAAHLTNLAPVVHDLTDILMSVKGACRPNAFYASIRPWYRGSDNEGDGLRWVYEGVEDSGSLELSGPSAGQTSTFHVLDALLGVEHNDRSRPFMERMLMYMPAEQRAMLYHLKYFAPQIRAAVNESEEVRKAYNSVLDAMTKFRTDHIQVAVRYVVSPKDKCPITGLSASSPAGCPAAKKSRGTGGNELSTMLKGSRDSTRDMRV